jgi:hypothetical protein
LSSIALGAEFAEAVARGGLILEPAQRDRAHWRVEVRLPT